MEPGVRAGTPIHIIQRTPKPVQLQGTVLAGLGRALAVKLATPWTGNQGEEVALITGEPGARLASKGRLVEARASVASFEVLTPWKPFDVRASPHFQTELTAEVRSVLGNSRQPGTIIDISLGGMAVETATKPGGREVAIVTLAGAYSATLPCTIVHTSRGDAGVTLHLKFGELSAAQMAFVRNLVAAAQVHALEAEREAS